MMIQSLQRKDGANARRMRQSWSAVPWPWPITRTVYTVFNLEFHYIQYVRYAVGFDTIFRCQWSVDMSDTNRHFRCHSAMLVLYILYTFNSIVYIYIFFSGIKHNCRWCSTDPWTAELCPTVLPLSQWQFVWPALFLMLFIVLLHQSHLPSWWGFCGCVACLFTGWQYLPSLWTCRTSCWTISASSADLIYKPTDSLPPYSTRIQATPSLFPSRM